MVGLLFLSVRRLSFKRLFRLLQRPYWFLTGVLRKRAEISHERVDQLLQLRELPGAEMAKHGAWHAIDMRIEVLEDLAPLVGDADLDDPAVLPAAHARHQSAAGEAIDEPGHVRITRNHPIRNFPAGEFRRM